MPVIDVGKDFYHRLVNRDKHQTDGKHNAVEFRAKYLSLLDNPDAWKMSRTDIVFDFANVKKIGPSFANEAFAYFTKYVKPKIFFEKIQFIHITKVQLMIIEEEMESGYSGQ